MKRLFNSFKNFFFVKKRKIFLPVPVNITTSSSFPLTDFLINARASSRNFVVCDEQWLDLGNFLKWIFARQVASTEPRQHAAVSELPSRGSFRPGSNRRTSAGRSGIPLGSPRPGARPSARPACRLRSGPHRRRSTT